MILVLEQENGKYVYRYMTEGERLESTGNSAQFQAKLLSTTKPVKLMLAGNYGDAFAAYAPSPGRSEAEVKAGIGCSFTGAARSLPMYGEIAVPSGLEADRENRFSVKMLRAVARIDVEKDLTADSRSLRIESVRLYRPNDKIQLAPDEFFAPESPRGTVPSVFAGAVKSQSPVVTETSEPDPVSVAGIYVPEADEVADAAARLTDATCIVVGGYYDGQSQPTYYRVDFDPGLEGHPFGQILRNHRYVFRIRKVTGPGWSDPGLAAVNKATSIVAEIEPWEDFTTEMHFEGDNYIGLSSRSVTLGYPAGKTDTVDVQATVPYAIQWLDASGSLVGTAVSGVGASLPGNNGFTVSIGRNSGDAETVTRLVFATTGDNRTQSDVTARLRVTAGRWTLDAGCLGKAGESGEIPQALYPSAVGDGSGFARNEQPRGGKRAAAAKDIGQCEKLFAFRHGNRRGILFLGGFPHGDAGHERGLRFRYIPECEKHDQYSGCHLPDLQYLDFGRFGPGRARMAPRQSEPGADRRNRHRDDQCELAQVPD